MVELVVTEYRNVYDVKNARVVTYPWLDFTRRLEKPFVYKNMSWESYKDLPIELSQEQKNAGLWDVETRSKIKQLAGGAVYGRMVLPDGVEEAGRRAEYFPKRSAIVYDFEHCTEDIFARLEIALQDVTYAYHSTCSHRPQDGDIRLHVIVPFDKETDWQLYTVTAIDIAMRIGLDGLDKSCIKRAQMELYCVQLRDNEYIYNVHNIRNTEGNVEFLNAEKWLQDKYNTVDIKDVVKLMGIDLHEWSPELAKELKPAKTVLVGNKTYQYKPKVIMDDGKAKRFNVVSCFNAVFSCWDILDSLVEYTSHGDRYKYYSASSGAGVWVSDDGRYCGSYHQNSGDLLCDGHKHTAFDVWSLYHCDQNASFKEKLSRVHSYAKTNKKYYSLFYTGKVGKEICMNINALDGIARESFATYTESGTAKRIVALFSTEIKCCRDTGGIYIYNEKTGLWMRAEMGDVLKKLDEIAEAVQGDGSDVIGEERKRLDKYLRDLRTVYFLKHAWEMAKGWLYCEEADFDASSRLIGLPNCKVLDVVTGEIKDGKSEYMITCALGGFPKATISDEFRTYINAFLPVPEEQDYVQRYLGSCLLGFRLRNASDKKVLFMDSRGNTGKSTFIHALEASFGGYFRDAKIGVLTEKCNDSNKPNPLLGVLKGGRVAACSECPPNSVFSTDTFKNISGNDKCCARFPHDKKPFFFYPEFRMLVMSNILPRPDDGDDRAFRQRFRRIRRDSKLDDTDEKLNEKVWEQDFKDDFVTWVVEGCKKYMEIDGQLDDYDGENLETCNLTVNMKKYIRKYICQNDDMLDFFTAYYCRVEEENENQKEWISWQDIYADWKQYTDDNKTGFIKFCRLGRLAIEKWKLREKRDYVLTEAGKTQYLEGVLGLRRITSHDVYEKRRCNQPKSGKRINRQGEIVVKN